MQFIWQPTFEGIDGPITQPKGIFTHFMENKYNTPCQVPLSNFWDWDQQSYYR